MASSSRGMRAFANNFFDEWTDPNLTEPKLQDELNRRLAANDAADNRRQRPRAARRELKSAPDNGQEMTQIRYFKYIPYRGMSEPERRRYLSLGPARLTSSRTEPTPRQQRGSTAAAKPREDGEAAFWQSGSKARSLKVYDYHLAELSLAYRSPPALLSLPRRLATSSGGSRPEPRQTRHHQQQQQATTAVETPHRSLFYQIHTSRTARASAPSDTQRQLTQAEKTTQVSRGCTPFIESALSDNFPTEPGDVVSKSQSNRLLNVVSVDECHVRHRRRRRRLRRIERAAATREGDSRSDDGEEEEAEEAEEEEEWGEEEDVVGIEEPAVDEGLNEVPTTELPEPPAPELRHESEADVVVPSVISTRPTTERSKKSKRRSEKEMRRLAAAKFLRRNEILREKMAIYLDWKLNQERMGLSDIREGDAATRFERFTVELVRQEALVANQYRGMDGPGDNMEGAVADNLADEYYSSPTLMLDNERGVAGGEAGESRLRPELSLSEMFEALKA